MVTTDFVGRDALVGVGVAMHAFCYPDTLSLYY